MKKELTKGDVYVVVDTPKKAKKLKNLLDMFKEPMFTIPNNEWSSHNGIDYGWGYGFSNELWQGFNTKSIAHNGKRFEKVSIKELRNILAKEHLRNLYTERLEPKRLDKFAELKEAHRNGAVIQFKFGKDYWEDVDFPMWDDNYEYRIKPEEIKDSDIATIEALHDVLLDNHKYDLNSKLLTNARELCKKLQNIVGD